VHSGSPLVETKMYASATQAGMKTFHNLALCESEFDSARSMSADPRKSDIRQVRLMSANVPIADIHNYLSMRRPRSIKRWVLKIVNNQNGDNDIEQ
jgi:hypothetical protein